LIILIVKYPSGPSYGFNVIGKRKINANWIVIIMHENKIIFLNIMRYVGVFETVADMLKFTYLLTLKKIKKNYYFIF